MNVKQGWLTGGMLLGVVFLAAIWIIKPIGVSTQFVIFDGIAWNLLDKNLVSEDSSAKYGYSSTNDYLDKSGGKYAAEVKNPLNYGFIFVLSMFLGGYISNFTSRKKISDSDKVSPAVWREKFGSSGSKRYIYAFVAGFLALFGARLAGGCTSGHMMSGIMQTSVSGYLFAAAAFATAIPVAIIFYKKSEK